MKKILFILLLFLAMNSLFAVDDSAYKQGLQYYKAKKFLMAIGSFKSAIESGYQDASVFFYLANAYVNNEDFNKALEQYRYALEAANSPDFKGVIAHNIGYVYYLKKEYKKSIDYFSQAYTLDTNLNQTYWYKGMAYYHLRNKTNVITEWESYLTAIPNGRESDNIRKALAILKSANFDFTRDNLFPDHTGSSSSRGTPNIEPLIDIEGILDEVKPTDKGKEVDTQLEGIEK